MVEQYSSIVVPYPDPARPEGTGAPVDGVRRHWLRRIIPALVLLGALRSDALSGQFTAVTGVDPVIDGGHSFAVSWADYDNDGYLDLFVGNWTSANCLYHNNGDGTFSRVTSIPISTGMGTLSSAWADYDNDGDLDAYMANVGTGGAGRRNCYYRNDGNGVFAEITEGEHVADSFMSQSAAPADYDRDGDLDLYVVNHCPPPNCSGIYNQFFQNDGLAGFSLLNPGDLGMDSRDRTSASWADYDDDGDPDLSVAAGMRRSAIMENDGDGTFTVVTEGPLAADSGSCGFSWGDFDNDQDLDVFAACSDGLHNRLYRNIGGGDFEAVTGQGVVTDESWSEGACWGDYDNDGDIDLFVANNRYYQKRLNFLYRNNGDGTFTRVTDECVTTELHASTSGAWADYDRDGFLDLLVTNCYGGNENNSLYHNGGNGNHWIHIDGVNDRTGMPDIGARISIKATIGGTAGWQTREISGQAGFHSQPPMEAHFGLGDATSVDSVNVRWSDGLSQIWSGLGVDQFLVLTHDFTTGIRTERDHSMGRDLRLGPVRPNPFQDYAAFDLWLARPGPVTVTVHDPCGRLSATLLGGRDLRAGSQRLTWNGRDTAGSAVAPGVYFLRVIAGDDRQSGRLVVIR